MNLNDIEFKEPVPVKFTENDIISLFTNTTILVERIYVTFRQYRFQKDRDKFSSIISDDMFERQLHIVRDSEDLVYCIKSRLYPTNEIVGTGAGAVTKIVKETIAQLEELGYTRYVTGV